MAKVRAEVEINASPEDVRKVILDFSKIPEWHDSFMKSLNTIPAGGDALRLVPGDKISVGFSGNMVEPVITSNTKERFTWLGSTLQGAFAGEHYFEFPPSKTTPGGTTFAHGEDYCGWLTWMFDDWLLGIGRGYVERMYIDFAQDVKKRVESLKADNSA